MPSTLQDVSADHPGVLGGGGLASVRTSRQGGLLLFIYFFM